MQEQHNLVKTVYGLGVILNHFGSGEPKEYRGFRIRLTENSWSPGTIIEFLPEDMVLGYEE